MASIAKFCQEECAELTVDAHGRQYRLWTRDCPSPDCPLFPYRNGLNQNRAKVGGRPPQQRQTPLSDFLPRASGLPRRGRRRGGPASATGRSRRACLRN